jgi:drug/metabolite transporter (DMT)-like permease
MDTFALILVVMSAFCHAYWNLVLKKTSGGVMMIWLFTAITVVLYVPFFIYLELDLSTMVMPPMPYVYAASMIFHVLYFIFLDRAYKYGELSMIYPIARGSAPVMTIFIATVFMGEVLSGLQAFSVILIVIGTFVLSGFSYSKEGRIASSLIYAFVCGLMVASYTLIDKQAVTYFGASPFILDFVNNVGRMLILLPFVLRDTDTFKKTASGYWKEAGIIALMSPVSYLLILFAMQHAPVSIIAPMRQLSIVIGAVLGVRLLSESRAYKKVAGIAITFIGVILLSL